MLDLDRELCVCNGITLGDIVKYIKENGSEKVEDLLDCDLDVGNKCETCVEDGYENDGFSLTMVLSLVKQDRL